MSDKQPDSQQSMPHGTQPDSQQNMQPDSLQSDSLQSDSPHSKQSNKQHDIWHDADGTRNFVASNGSGELADAMGMEFLEYTVERTVARMPVVGNRQTVGYLHGGAYVVLGESLGSMAANLHAGRGKLAVGVDVNATHLRSAKSGYVTGICTPVHLGRSLTVHEVNIFDDEGNKCCAIRITNMIKDVPQS